MNLLHRKKKHDKIYSYKKLKMQWKGKDEDNNSKKKKCYELEIRHIDK